jgi:hypothetical protein
LDSDGDGICDLCPIQLADYFNTGSYTVVIEFSNLTFYGPNSSSSNLTEPFNKVQISFEVVQDEMAQFTNTYQAGQFFDGVIASEVVQYTVSGIDILDSTGSALEIGATEAAQLALLTDAEQALQNIMYDTPAGWGQSLAWGIETGTLVSDDDLSELECKKDADGAYETHPEYTGTQATETRYCNQKLWGINNITSTYRVSVQTSPSYELTTSAGVPVVFSQPKVLHYTVPEETAYGDDAGKKIRLEYRGQNLDGIPGYVYDTATGEELGQFVHDWQPTYRYISRFNLPDGSTLVDATDDSVTYKTKARNGEEWLSDEPNCTGASPCAIGTMTYNGKRSMLVKNSKMKNLGPGGPDYIGVEPTTLINNGEPSVVHEEVVYDPTP